MYVPPRKKYHTPYGYFINGIDVTENVMEERPLPKGLDSSLHVIVVKLRTL